MTVLAGKVAIVTGSARGSCRATAELFAHLGAKMLINDLDAHGASPTSAETEGVTSVIAGQLTATGAPAKINVNAVAFGYIETRLTASKDESNVMEIGGEKVQLGIPDQLRGMAAMMIPLGRPGTPQEAAGGVFFLVSPWSNYVHGQVLNITGGQFTGMTS